MTQDNIPRRKHPLGASLAPVLAQAIRTRTPALLSGDSGIGKSEFVHHMADQLGLELVVVNLALLESPGELSGLLEVEDGHTVNRPPRFLPRSGAGILLFEEPARSSSHVLAALYEFLTSRRLGEYELPAGWTIVACINPPGEEYDGQPFDRAMRDRFLHLDVVADLQQWLDWATRNGVHPAILAAVRSDARVFLLASPRSWTRASVLLVDGERHGMDAATIEAALVSQLRSPEAAHAIMRHRQGGAPEVGVAAEDVLARYARDQSMQAAVQGLLQSGRTDSVEKLVYAVEQLVAGDRLAGLIGRGEFDVESLERFASDVPGDRGRDLLRCFADNPAAALAVKIEPEQALLGYRRSPLYRSIAQWLQNSLTHRVKAVVHRIVQHLDRLDIGGRTPALRNSRAVRINLGHVLEHVGDSGGPLRAMLGRLQIEPLAGEEAA